MNMGAGDVRFRLSLADNRHSAFPPEMPVCSVMPEQAGGNRLMSDTKAVVTDAQKLTLLGE